MRHQFIDIAKLGGIFFVILGHLPTSAYIHTYIYSFHMPLFFIISGYLHKPYSNQETIKRNTYTLIIPYILLFTCVQILELQDIFRRGNINFSLVGSTLATSFKAMILGEPRIYVGPLWFLISLFEIKIIANILLKQKQSVIIIGCLCCLVLGYFCQYKNEFSYFFLDSTVIAFPFYIIGSYLRKYNFENDTFSLHHYNQAYNKTTKLKKVSLLIILIAITNILSYYNGAIDIDYCRCGKSFILTYITGFIGSYMFLLASSLFHSNKFTTTISKSTIFILAFHYFIIKKVDLWIFIRNDINLTTNTKSIILALSTVVISYPQIILTKKYFPILIGNRK